MSQLLPIEIAYQLLEESKKALPFTQIWEHVKTVLSIPEAQEKQKKVKLYSTMMLDPRFSSLKDNIWDLANRVKYEDKHVDTDELIIDDEEEEEEIDESEMVDEEEQIESEYEPEIDEDDDDGLE